MIAYASQTGGIRNVSALHRNGFRILLTPFSTGGPSYPQYGVDFPYCCDNGAWRAFKEEIPFDETAFLKMLDEYQEGADFVVIPDIVGGGQESYDFSMSWLERLRARPIALLLFAAQDGISLEQVRGVLADNIGFAVGGTTEWKEDVLRSVEWADLASDSVWAHVLRVNSLRRIRACQDWGATSFDGTSASIYSVNAPKIAAQRDQRTIWE